MQNYLEAKSIHTFAWPFTFEVMEKTLGQFEKKLEKKGWKRKETDFRKTGKNTAQVQECFMLEQYMSTSAKKLFFDEASRACEIFEYPLDAKEEYVYSIVTRVEENADEKVEKKGKKSGKADAKVKEITYNLPITGIELHVYKYGIGILFLRTLNMDKNSTVEDIKRINDKGRSISLPFLPDEEDGHILCAESLGIITKEWGYVTSFREKIRAYYQTGEAALLEQMSKSADFLYYVLNVNLDYSKENDIEVKPTSDYRMFVFSLIRDSELSNKLKKLDSESFDTETEREELEKLLYSILYVDEKAPSCQHHGMREKLFEDSAYLRWMGVGTFYGATDYSFVCITTDSDAINSNTVRPFYVEYIYMVSLVLAQRHALMNFSVKADGVADLLHAVNDFLLGIVDRILKTSTKKLVRLQEDYIVLKNRLMVLEFSNQEQGIELYHLLQKQLLVEQEKEILDEQLQGLYDVVNTRNSTRNAWWSLALAVIALIVGLITGSM